MKWLKRKLRNWITDSDDEMEVGIIQRRRDVEATVCEDDPILNFRVFSAVGGQVVEFRHYDRKTDRDNITVYIINKDEDFGEKISKITNLEMLK